LQILAQENPLTERGAVSEFEFPQWVGSGHSLNTSYFAGAPNDEGVASPVQIWSGLRRNDVFPFTFSSAVSLAHTSRLNHSRYKRPGGIEVSLYLPKMGQCDGIANYC
jgi:hypothetical protein